MNRYSLGSYLEKNYSKEEILKLTNLAALGRIKVGNVLDLCFSENPRLVFRAAWLLEHIAVTYPHLLKRDVKRFLKCYHLQQNESAQRCFSKIAIEVVVWADLYKVSYRDFESCLSASFDWLLDQQKPVAIQCNCLDVIYALSSYKDWIQEELERILERNLLSDSPALLSRTKSILKKIDGARKKVVKAGNS